MKGQSHPQRGPGQALTSGGVAETGVGGNTQHALRGGGWGLGGPGVAPGGRVGCPLWPISTARHLWPWCQETGAEKVPEKSSGGSGGSRHVWSLLLSARLVCAQSEAAHRHCIPSAPTKHCPEGSSAGRKANFPKKNLPLESLRVIRQIWPGLAVLTSR